jgi:osmoprotectant transport system ATP-binding protein
LSYHCGRRAAFIAAGAMAAVERPPQHRLERGLAEVARPLIEIERACKSFDGGRSFAVEDLTLAVEAGGFLALVGASGCGKTTTLKFINRLLDPDSGTVRIDGEPVVAAEVTALRRSIGYVFQRIGFFPHMSVGENIGITPQLLRWPRPEIESRVQELLDLVGLPQAYAARNPDMLSGGELQRAAVARAIAARPRIVLMDEPFGALDPITRDTVGSAYRRLHERLGLTTIMVTHDVQEAMLLADRIAVMKSGRILAHGTPRELSSPQADPDVAAFFAVPRQQADRVRAILDGGRGPDD